MLMKVDHFDRLPDALLLFILSNSLDAKTLIRCLLVSKRFASIIPQIDTIFVTLPPHFQNKKRRRGLSRKVFKILARKLIIKPMQVLHHIMTCTHAANSNSDHFLYYSPNEVLKNFNGLKSLHLELPSLGSEIEFNGGSSLLKWKAEFGEELKSCTILSSKCFCRENLSSSSYTYVNEREEEEEELQSFLAEDELKSRIVWTISCLVSASVRHHLLKQIVPNFPTLQRLVITDAGKRGKLCMGKEQLVELRNSMNSPRTSESSLERTPIPKLCMKLWYVPVMELPALGYAMKEVALVLIKPVSGVIGKVVRDGDLLVADDLLVSDDFDGEDEEKVVFGEAVREIIKKKVMYVMEMSSF
ncbi:F-box protein At4g18380-like [Castanea sativa]|uniref:F-box protein At4g18380-like n=1 Tax=Castanea sativa TaxID=21020 RepID=UPI003F64FBE1